VKTFFSAFVAALPLSPVTSARAEKVAPIEVDGTIDPATDSYIARDIDRVTAYGTLPPPS